MLTPYGGGKIITSINFSNNPPNVRTLRREEGKGDPVPFRVVKVIQLTMREFEHFMSHLLDDAPYIAANSALTGKDPTTGEVRCLLVVYKGGRNGILVKPYRKPRARQER